jgi:hypothetical protein
MGGAPVLWQLVLFAVAIGAATRSYQLRSAAPQPIRSPGLSDQVPRAALTHFLALGQVCEMPR